MLAAVLVLLRLLVFATSALGPQPSATTTTIPESVGAHGTIFLGGFEVHGKHRVHVRSVRITGVPEGVRVVAVRALDFGPVAGSNHGDPDPLIRDRLRPVTDMVFTPGAPREEWGLVVVLEAVKPGMWVTTGVDVAWKAGWRSGTTHYDYRVGMEVSS